jgi:hypothetical protein
MCGIIGLICKNKNGFYTFQADLFTNMLRMDSIRGEDSTGVFGITRSGELDYLKGDADGYKFTNCDDYNKFCQRMIKSYNIVIGHNRKATKGAISAQNAHPFVQKHICLVHNGTIHNSKDLNTEVEVDSEAIAHALADHDAPAALKKLSGAFALVWFDKKDKTLSLARNDQRTLHLVEYDNYWVISSEIGLPLWLQGREARKHISHALVPTNKILMFNLNDLDAVPKEMEYEAYKHYTPPVKDYSHYAPRSNPPIVRQFPRGAASQLPVLLDGTNKVQSLKTGDVVKFKVESYDEQVGDRCLLGHPIFGEDLDENIYVQAIVPKGEQIHTYLSQGDFFTATVVHVRQMGHRMVIFARDPVLCKLVSDVGGEVHDVNEITPVLKTGCSRCFKDMFLKDIGQSVVQKKKDGTWRKVCPTCVEASIQQAKAEKSLILPASTNVQ